MSRKRNPGASTAAARQFGADLDALRRAVGDPPYRDMAELAHYSHSMLCRARQGDRVPTWGVTEGFVKACGVPPGDWRPRWEAAKAAEEAEKKAAEDPTIPMRPAPTQLSDDPRGQVADVATHLRPQRGAVPLRRERPAGPERLPVGEAVGKLPLPPTQFSRDIAEHLTTSRLREALCAEKALGLPLLATLTQLVGSDDACVVAGLVDTVLDQRTRIDRLECEVVSLKTSLRASSSANPSGGQATLDVRLIPTGVYTESGNEQLKIVGTSTRPPGAHRQPVDQQGGSTTLTASPSTERGQRGREPGATVRPLPTRRTADPNESIPIELPAGTEATGTETGAPAVTICALPTSSTTTSSATLSTTPVKPVLETKLAEDPASLAPRTRTPIWIRHQTGIRVLLLWLIALEVCAYVLLFTSSNDLSRV